MPKIKKFQIFLIAMFWLCLSLLVLFIGMPIALVLMFFGVLLALAHVNFLADWAHCLLSRMVIFLRYVTKRIRKLVQEVDKYEGEKKTA